MMKNRPRPAAAHPEDAADLADTVRSPGFALIQARLKSLRNDYVQQLVTATSWPDVVALQAQIRCVDTLTEVPEILRRELTAAKFKE